MADCHVQAPPSGSRPSGIIRKSRSPCSACKVHAVCPKCGKATRVGYKILEDGSKKIRVCTGKHGCGEQF